MATATASAPPAKSKSNTKRYIILIALGVISAVVLKLGVFLLFFGMLPAIVAYETDHTRFKFLFSTVAAFNFAGVFPDMMQVFIEGGSFEILKIKLLDPSVWLIMYGSAALGWSLVWLSPIIASTTLEGIYSGRILHLEGLQKRGEEEWGPEVKGLPAVKEED
jgi:hypothetical protein